MNKPLIVLSVDDDPVIRSIIAMAMRSDSAIALLLARSAIEALALIRTSPPPNAILLDYYMPQTSGLELA